ncbi:hypothetical protein OUZ56_021863 [Daphnia magna]|uniref:Uncharacterized protein n=1 Tax=Daphnia magna TaxID=35525 RepID=A0ABR0AUV9_9CRUS|nr:hypothetical protein OUZ56_021863 [Daphnia magna]
MKILDSCNNSKSNNDRITLCDSDTSQNISTCSMVHDTSSIAFIDVDNLSERNDDLLQRNIDLERKLQVANSTIEELNSKLKEMNSKNEELSLKLLEKSKDLYSHFMEDYDLMVYYTRFSKHTLSTR